jgi:histidinol dehydrogenase
MNNSKNKKFTKTISKIIDDIKINKDKAVKKYSLQFDKSLPYELTSGQIKKAYNALTSTQIKEIKNAASAIKKFSRRQFSQYKEFSIKINGGIIGQKVIPLQKVGCYVPGGRFPLPSTALMTVIPAKVAGVKDIIVCSPNIKPAVIVAANIAGADKIFSIGGVQAIASLAYGTQTIPKVDKIVGPGNKYVAEAKRLLFGDVGIDFVAGPSEILIIADETDDSKLIAADMLAQCEHDPDAKAVFITNSKALAKKVNMELSTQEKNLKTRDISIKAKKQIIVVDSLTKAVEIANELAPEHLELQIRDEKIIGQLYNFGSLFIGKNSAEVFGDYCSGINHTLPTNRTARFSGGLSPRDFVKIVTYQKLNSNVNKLIKTASTLAEIEGLDAHRIAAELRVKRK